MKDVVDLNLLSLWIAIEGQTVTLTHWVAALRRRYDHHYIYKSWPYSFSSTPAVGFHCLMFLCLSCRICPTSAIDMTRKFFGAHSTLCHPRQTLVEAFVSYKWEQVVCVLPEMWCYQRLAKIYKQLTHPYVQQTLFSSIRESWICLKAIWNNVLPTSDLKYSSNFLSS